MKSFRSDVRQRIRREARDEIEAAERRTESAFAIEGRRPFVHDRPHAVTCDARACMGVHGLAVVGAGGLVLSTMKLPIIHTGTSIAASSAAAKTVSRKERFFTFVKSIGFMVLASVGAFPVLREKGEQRERRRGFQKGAEVFASALTSAGRSRSCVKKNVAPFRFCGTHNAAQHARSVPPNHRLAIAGVITSFVVLGASMNDCG